MIKRSVFRCYPYNSYFKNHHQIPLDRNELIKLIDINDDYKIEKYINENKHYDVEKTLFKFCITNNDEELLDKVLDKYKLGTHNGNHYVDIIVKSKNNIFDKLIDFDGFVKDKMDELFNRAIEYNNLYIINKLQDLDNTITERLFCNILFYGQEDYVNSAIHKCDNIQKVFDDNCAICNIGKMSIDKLKYFINIGINMDKHLNSLIIRTLHCNVDDNVVILLHKLGAANINEALRFACRNNNENMVTYFLNNGAIIEPLGHWNSPTYKILKILLDNNQILNDKTIELIFVNMLKCGNIDDIEKTYDQFDNLNINNILQNDKNRLDNLDISKQNRHEYPTILEHIIFKNYVDVMKFIIKHNNDILDINILFISACCNGNVEMVELLLDVNNNVNYTLAFECAIYFGHYELVTYLFKYDITLNNDMILMWIYGVKKDSQGYFKILEKCDLIYDRYNFKYNHNYKGILQILFDNELKMSLEMLKILGYYDCDMNIIIHILDNNIDINEIMSVIINVPCYRTFTNQVIIKYLLDNGANPNVDKVENAEMKVFIKNYRNDCL